MATRVKAEQTEIPGTERPKIDAIERAAKRYEKARDAMQEAVADEVKTKESLQRALHENEAQLVERDKLGNPGYVYLDDGEPKIAILKRSEEGVQVKKWNPKKKADKKAED